ncbi:transmembrane and immunoglobulin domain-containing protein 1 [Nerophis lumbriciformis]|uniref:transmembrane and immunoglobulin domain-containing protein 1 n=1 Tax=Nerophis lumbriciformis TaxID=546530 RepID=UPI002ADF4E83|nr:transmembrane and immunoglobulin domain-containing protein 1-like [Nerophis lumbriciformis]XP_061818890.1 transmembrane and immunoglobulin domain-containing protein 1-like [Nerophis lumbriciformis]
MKSCCLLVLLICGAQAQIQGVAIEAAPGADVHGTIHTQLDKTVSLLCRALEEGAELVWRRNGAMVSLKAENQRGNSSVCVTPVLHQDNGATFSCHLGKNATVQDAVTLNVTFPPVLSESEDVSVEEKSPLVLSCETFANPPVSPPLWTLNDSTVDLLAGSFSVTNDGSTSRLSCGAVDRGLHEGRYQCTVDSPLHGTRTRVFRVTVTDKTTKFPLMPIIAGVVVVFLTGVFAIFSRWSKITKCCK